MVLMHILVNKPQNEHHALPFVPFSFGNSTCFKQEFVLHLKLNFLFEFQPTNLDIEPGISVVAFEVGQCFP